MAPGETLSINAVLRRAVLLCLWVGAALCLLPSVAVAQQDLKTFDLGYIGWNEDPRYSEARIEREYQGEPWGRPIDGARVAIDEARFPGIAAGVQFGLDEALVSNTREVLENVRRMRDAGTRFILLDLPAGTVSRVAAEFAGDDLTLFNVAAHDGRLRGAHCQANLLHTIPSDAMRNDALAQYLVSRQWKNVLLLVGPEAADKVLAKSFARSAKRFGLNITGTREFVLGNNPRERDKNNPKLLTSGIDYDAVYIADTQSEFARNANFAIQKPRPVVGSGGLVPQAWHWAWVRHGARQLNNRLEKKADRHMTAYDWAAWVAVKAVVEAVQRTDSTDYAQLAAYVRGDDINLDGFKGYRMGFRDWDGQLRQPILLGSGNWVVARAPLEGFLHPDNYLDTLGFDPRESACKLTTGNEGS
jgi:ABC transporter substrate binding protein (PQQ-dependent alcohol dehydrogenase system)